MTAVARITDDAWADEQYQQSLRVLSDHHARTYEAARPIREPKARQRIADWLLLAAKSEARADGYLSDAARHAASHKDHHYYLRLANEQLALAASARRRAEIERNSL